MKKRKKKPAAPRWKIAVAIKDTDVRRCYPVMRQLRPQFVRVEEFVKQVARQQKEGYRIAFLEAGGEVCGVAGYRILESLVSGKFLYVDDLVTRDTDRSRGFGGDLLEWLVDEARKEGCQYLELDSGVQRFDAHRFYLRQRMHISSYHFRMAVESVKSA